MDSVDLAQEVHREHTYARVPVQRRNSYVTDPDCSDSEDATFVHYIGEDCKAMKVAMKKFIAKELKDSLLPAESEGLTLIDNITGTAYVLPYNTNKLADHTLKRYFGDVGHAFAIVADRSYVIPLILDLDCSSCKYAQIFNTPIPTSTSMSAPTTEPSDFIATTDLPELHSVNPHAIDPELSTANASSCSGRKRMCLQQLQIKYEVKRLIDSITNLLSLDLKNGQVRIFQSATSCNIHIYISVSVSLIVYNTIVANMKTTSMLDCISMLPLPYSAKKDYEPYTEIPLHEFFLSFENDTRTFSTRTTQETTAHLPFYVKVELDNYYDVEMLSILTSERHDTFKSLGIIRSQKKQSTHDSGRLAYDTHVPEDNVGYVTSIPISQNTDTSGCRNASSIHYEHHSASQHSAYIAAEELGGPDYNLNSNTTRYDDEFTSLLKSSDEMYSDCCTSILTTKDDIILVMPIVSLCVRITTGVREAIVVLRDMHGKFESDNRNLQRYINRCSIVREQTSFQFDNYLKHLHESKEDTDNCREFQVRTLKLLMVKVFLGICNQTFEHTHNGRSVSQKALFQYFLNMVKMAKYSYSFYTVCVFMIVVIQRVTSRIGIIQFSSLVSHSTFADKFTAASAHDDVQNIDTMENVATETTVTDHSGIETSSSAYVPYPLVEKATDNNSATGTNTEPVLGRTGNTDDTEDNNDIEDDNDKDGDDDCMSQQSDHDEQELYYDFTNQFSVDDLKHIFLDILSELLSDEKPSDILLLTRCIQSLHNIRYENVEKEFEDPDDWLRFLTMAAKIEKYGPISTETQWRESLVKYFQKVFLPARFWDLSAISAEEEYRGQIVKILSQFCALYSRLIFICFDQHYYYDTGMYVAINERNMTTVSSITNVVYKNLIFSVDSLINYILRLIPSTPCHNKVGKSTRSTLNGRWSNGSRKDSHDNVLQEVPLWTVTNGYTGRQANGQNNGLNQENGGPEKVNRSKLALKRELRNDVWLRYISNRKVFSSKVHFNRYEFFISTNYGIFNTLTGSYMATVPMLYFVSKKSYAIMNKDMVNSNNMNELNLKLEHDKPLYSRVLDVVQGSMNELFNLSVLLPSLMAIEYESYSELMYVQVFTLLMKRFVKNEVSTMNKEHFFFLLPAVIYHKIPLSVILTVKLSLYLLVQENPTGSNDSIIKKFIELYTTKRPDNISVLEKFLTDKLHYTQAIMDYRKYEDMDPLHADTAGLFLAECTQFFQSSVIFDIRLLGLSFCVTVFTKYCNTNILANIFMAAETVEKDHWKRVRVMEARSTHSPLTPASMAVPTKGTQAAAVGGKTTETAQTPTTTSVAPDENKTASVTFYTTSSSTSKHTSTLPMKRKLSGMSDVQGTMHTQNNASTTEFSSPLHGITSTCTSTTTGPSGSKRRCIRRKLNQSQFTEFYSFIFKNDNHNFNKYYNVQSFYNFPRAILHLLRLKTKHTFSTDCTLLKNDAFNRTLYFLCYVHNFDNATFHDYLHYTSSIYETISRKVINVYVGVAFGGKTTLLKMINEIGGSASFATDTIFGDATKGGSSAPQPDVIRMGRAYSITITEVKHLTSSFLKILTGGDQVSKRGLNQNEYRELCPIAFIAGAANDLPSFDTVDEAIRIRVMPFLFEKVLRKLDDCSTIRNAVLLYASNIIPDYGINIKYCSIEFANILYAAFTKNRNKTTGQLQLKPTNENSLYYINRMLIENGQIYKLLHDSGIVFHDSLCLDLQDIQSHIVNLLTKTDSKRNIVYADTDIMWLEFVERFHKMFLARNIMGTRKYVGLGFQHRLKRDNQFLFDTFHNRPSYKTFLKIAVHKKPQRPLLIADIYRFLCRHSSLGKSSASDLIGSIIEDYNKYFSEETRSFHHLSMKPVES